MCICQSKIQDPYYCLQDPTMSDVHNYSHHASFRLLCKGHKILLAASQAHHKCSVSSSCICCSLPWKFLPQMSSVSDQQLPLLKNDHFKNGISWNFLSFDHLYFFSWQFSLSGTTLHIYLIIFLSKLSVNSLRAGFYLFHSQMSPRFWSNAWHTVDIK